MGNGQDQGTSITDPMVSPPTPGTHNGAVGSTDRALVRPMGYQSIIKVSTVEKVGLPASVKAAGLVVAAAATGLALGTHYGEWGSLVIPVVWLAGIWYCIARVSESRAMIQSKAILYVLAVIVATISPYILCAAGGDAPVIFDLFQHGWRTGWVSDRQRACVIFVGACLALFGTVQITDWLIRKRVGRQQEGDASSAASAPPRIGLNAWFAAWVREVRWRVALPLIGVFVLFLTAMVYVPGIYQSWSMHFERLEAQEQCLNYTDPPSMVIFSNDPALSNVLTATGYYSASNWQSPIRQLPMCWNTYTLNGRPNGTPVVLHRMRAADGIDRLVALNICEARHELATGAVDFTEVYFVESIFGLGTRLNSPVDVNLSNRKAPFSISGWSCLSFKLLAGNKLTVYAGQLNSSDASAFTIDYVLNGVRDTIDGKLTETGITLTRRLATGDSSKP